MPGSSWPGTFALNAFRRPDWMDSVRLVHRDEQHIATWNGGTTTEIAIYPETSAYSRRDFIWRISSATVETDESEFTSLPGFWRLIMVLEGELVLEHEHDHGRRLLPFEQDSFAGDWVTRSRGRARDFNLMLARGCMGELHAVGVEPESHVALAAQIHQPCESGTKGALMVYGADGMVIAETGAERIWTVGNGDALLLALGREPAVEPLVLWNKGHDLTHVVVARICSPEVP